MQKEKNPLYRKVNTKARGVSHNFGTDFKDTKSTKREPSSKMKQGVRRGLDYTPLYKFLLSKVGKNFDEVYSEAVGRLNTPDPIANMVVENKDLSDGYFRCGESSYYSELYVDTDGFLQLVDPELRVESFKPSCGCCTHTFNGLQFTKKFRVTR